MALVRVQWEQWVQWKEQLIRVEPGQQVQRLVERELDDRTALGLRMRMRMRVGRCRIGRACCLGCRGLGLK